MEVVVLGGDGVWITRSWKIAGLMVWKAVGADDPFATGDGDGDAIGADAGLDAVCVSVASEREGEEQKTGEFRCN